MIHQHQIAEMQSPVHKIYKIKITYILILIQIILYKLIEAGI